MVCDIEQGSAAEASGAIEVGDCIVQVTSLTTRRPCPGLQPRPTPPRSPPWRGSGPARARQRGAPTARAARRWDGTDVKDLSVEGIRGRLKGPLGTQARPAPGPAACPPQAGC